MNSNLFRSAAFPSGSGPDFVNAATGIVTTLSAPDLLAQLHAIEHQAGRIRQTRWGPRTLDLDLVALGDLVLPDTAEQTRWRTLPPADQPEQAPDQLILPHPRLQDRAFVLIPLAEIAPDWKHPQTGQTVFDMLAACSAQDIASVTAMTT